MVIFSKPLHRCAEKGANPFLRLLHFTLDPYLIMLSFMQSDIKYHYLSLWYGEHFTHSKKGTYLWPAAIFIILVINI